MDSHPWQMAAMGREVHAHFKPRARPALDERLRSGTGRCTWPGCTRFEARSPATRHPAAISLIWRRAVQARVRPLAVVPVDKRIQFQFQGAPCQRQDAKGTNTLLLQCSDEALDDCDGARLADRTEALTDALAGTPVSEGLRSELCTLVGDQVPRRSVRTSNLSEQLFEIICGRLLGEDAKTQDAPE